MLWVYTKSNNIVLYSSIGNSCSVWEHNYPPATSAVLQLFSSLYLHTYTWLAFVFLSALVLTLLHQYKLPFYLYLVSPLENEKLWKAPLLAIFLQWMPLFLVLFFIFRSWSRLETHDTITSFLLECFCVLAFLMNFKSRMLNPTAYVIQKITAHSQDQENKKFLLPLDSWNSSVTCASNPRLK